MDWLIYFAVFEVIYAQDFSDFPSQILKSVSFFFSLQKCLCNPKKGLQVAIPTLDTRALYLDGFDDLLRTEVIIPLNVILMIAENHGKETDSQTRISHFDPCDNVTEPFTRQYSFEHNYGSLHLTDKFM